MTEHLVVDVGDRDPLDCDDPFAPDHPIDELGAEERPRRRRATVEPFGPPPFAHLTRAQLEHELAFGVPAIRQVLARAELVRRADAPTPTLFSA